jgi:hypothetical protein
MLTLTLWCEAGKLYLEHHCDRFFVFPWSLTCPHLQNNTSYAPNIYFEIVSFLPRVDDLRRHVEDSTLHCRKRTAPTDVVCPFRYSKVRYFTDPIYFNENIIRFQVLLKVNNWHRETGKHHQRDGECLWSEDTPVR